MQVMAFLRFSKLRVLTAGKIGKWRRLKTTKQKEKITKLEEVSKYLPVLDAFPNATAPRTPLEEGPYLQIHGPGKSSGRRDHLPCFPLLPFPLPPPLLPGSRPLLCRNPRPREATPHPAQRTPD